MSAAESNEVEETNEIYMPPSEVLVGTENRTCNGCSKSFRTCECKSCSKCGSIFQKYWGTKIVKGRSHCRVCFDAVCVTCHMVVNETLKMCTRCNIRQKEDELCTQKALSAIDEAHGARLLTDSYAGINVAAASVLSAEQRKEVLFSAAKSGNHHIMVTILNAGVDMKCTDASKNTPLFYAAEGGFLPCVALLMERGASATVTNESGWTPLHAVAWKGSTDNHIECAELIIEMGADVFALTHTGETAGDLAERCAGKEELIQLLRAAEVELAVGYLKKRLDSAVGFPSKELHLKRCVETVVKHLTDSHTSSEVSSLEATLSSTSNSDKTDSSDNPSSPVTPRKGRNLPEELEARTYSLDRTSLRRSKGCDNCNKPKLSRTFGSSPSLNVPKADVEPILRTPSPNPNDVKPVIRTQYSLDGAMTYKYKEKLRELQDEKHDLEQRCKRLMQSIAVAAEDHEKEINHLKHELEVVREEKEISIKRCEATYANKMTKVRQEAETVVHQAKEQALQLEKDKHDLIHLHKNYKLTWVPDQLVEICNNHKCRAPFTQTRRRHHCRCCGRVFCNNCTSQRISIPPFGFMEPTRVCNSCFALIDDLFTEGLCQE